MQTRASANLVTKIVLLKYAPKSAQFRGFFYAQKKSHKAEIKIERFLSKEKTLRSGKKVKACITVKHSLDKKSRNLYSLEMIDTKKALGQARAKGQRQK
ncbi:MAG: hypothetical protein PUF61_02885 [Spirochaetales bacterium]|nr:hypothetical protein [Spirochaetales bacterium]